MKTYCLKWKIKIAAPVAEVWSFFSDPYNLEQITPPYMHFRIMKCPEPGDIYNGMLIEYRVKPVLGIPLRWVTRIGNVIPGQCFTDIQITGPYALWEHTHAFEAMENGTTLMHDKVIYALPLGPFGRMAHWLFVRRQLKQIFRYREDRVKALFPAH